MSLLFTGDPEQREGSDSAPDPPLESGCRDLRKPLVGASLEGTGLRAPVRSAARTEDSAEGGRRVRWREPPMRGHRSVVSPL